jgi:hypothetical protein
LGFLGFLPRAGDLPFTVKEGCEEVQGLEWGRRESKACHGQLTIRGNSSNDAFHGEARFSMDDSTETLLAVFSNKVTAVWYY